MEKQVKIKSLQKAIHLLSCFTVEEPKLGVSELAKRTGLLKSSVHNMLTTLEACSMIERTSDGKYTLGVRCLCLGSVYRMTRDSNKLIRTALTELSEITGVSKSTIDDLFAGRRKDISRTTAGMLEDVLIGGDSKWPCAMLVDAEKEVVYEDRPETLEALRINMEANQLKDVQIEELKLRNEELRKEHDKDIAKLRAYYEDDIKEYQELVAHMRTQINRKDDYIDRLARKAGI